MTSTDFKELGRFMSYYCQECGMHINEMDPPIYVKVEVGLAHADSIEVDIAGWAKKFADIMQRPLPYKFLCLECAHAEFVDELECHPGERKTKKKGNNV